MLKFLRLEQYFKKIYEGELDNSTLVTEIQWDLKVMRASWVVLAIMNLPANVGDLRDVSSIPGTGRPPGEGNGNHSSILAWRIPWTEEPWRAIAHGITWGHAQ